MVNQLDWINLDRVELMSAANLMQDHLEVEILFLNSVYSGVK